MKTARAGISSFSPRVNEDVKEMEPEDQDGHDVACTPFCYAKPAVEKPLTTCCYFCGGLVMFLLILVGFTGAGVEVIRFSNDVPFYLYDYTVYKEQVTIKSAFDVASARLDGELRERQQLESDFQLKVIYKNEDGNTLFDPEILAKIKAMEESIVAVADYTKFCALKYDFDEDDPICVRHDSALSFFDSSWWVPALDPPPSPTVPSEYNAELVMNQSTLAAFDRDHYYAFADPQDIGGADNVNLDHDNVEAIVEYWARYCSDAEDCPTSANGEQSPYAMTVSGENVTVSNQLVSIVDTGFSIQGDDVETTAKALQSVFYFGSPQYDEDEDELFAVNTQGMVDQRVELGAFLLDEVSDILEDGIDGIEVFWSGDGNGMLDAYLDSILTSNMMLLIYSILFIVVYLVFQLRSWWLGLVGILMILGNFGPSLIIYRAVFGSSYFGTLNALAIFLALGIGADDIFVFSNTWKHIRRSNPDMPVVLQLQKTLKIGGKAMLVTSLTTAVSFLVNASSHFPAVQSFGVFSAVLILCNFVLVITLFPAAYMVYEYYMYDPNKKQGCCRSTCHVCCKNPTGFGEMQGDVDEPRKADSLVRFFQDRLYPFLHRFRWASLLIYTGIIATYIIVGSRLEPDSEAPQLLPDGDQYVQVGDEIDTFFSHSDVSEAITVKIPFGIAGIDRDDCDGDPCDPTIHTDYGAPIWDTGIQDLSNEYTQKWFLDFCDAIESAAESDNTLMVYEPDESNPTTVSCPFREFKNWCEQGTGRCNQSHALGDDEYIVDAADFDETLQTFLMDELPVSSANVLSTQSTNLDLWDGQIRYEEDSSSGELTLRYVSIEVLLDAEWSLKFNDGINLYRDWGDFVDEWKAKAATEEYQGADVSVSSGFVNDDLAFEFFFLQKRIIQEAFTGIGLSLVGAFIIVCLATANWRISAMAIFTIATMVGGVVSFTVLNNWSLGVLEAVLFVMVIGFSVDYTIHLSDAYLESTRKTRTERTQDMLATMGPSVLSGAVSTIGACFPMLFAYFVFFSKFGTVIFFIIVQSLVFSIFFYSAMLDVMGPEARAWGASIRKGRQVLVKMGAGEEAYTNGVSEARGNHGSDEEATGQLSPGKILATDAETCTVLLEGDAEVSLPIAHCKLRYEAGHIILVDSCMRAIGEGLRSCYQKMGRKRVIASDNPK